MRVGGIRRHRNDNVLQFEISRSHVSFIVALVHGQNFDFFSYVFAISYRYSKLIMKVQHDSV